MALAEAVGMRGVRASVLSFEAEGNDRRELETEKRRERLSPSEARLVRYVLSEWSGDASGGSRWAEMIREEEVSKAAQQRSREADSAAVDVEALALRRATKRALRLASTGRTRAEARAEAWARADEQLRAYCQEMHVSGGASLSKVGACDQHGYPLLEGAENWSARGRRAAGEIVRAWRAITALDRRRPDLACALVRLHGDSLPGDRGVNPFAASYKADLAREYALVADRVGLGSWAELKAALQKRKAAGPEAEMARSAMLREAARRSEHLIVAAVRGYREEHGRAEA